jgi:DNA-binding PadR family transcriptional regulator
LTLDIKEDKIMEKLTPAQEKELKRIIDHINYGKQFSSAEELYNSWGYTTKWEDLKSEYQAIHIEDYNNRLNNITLTSANSSTLRALEKKGYIEIIRDGKKDYDIVKVLQFL